MFNGDIQASDRGWKGGDSRPCLSYYLLRRAHIAEAYDCVRSGRPSIPVYLTRVLDSRDLL